MEDNRRNLLWPIVLIVAGILILLVQFGVLSLNWEQAWRLWPVLLILAGLSVLLRETRHGWIVLLLAAVLLLGGGALWLQRSGLGSANLTTEELSYPLGAAESARVQLDVGIGTLKLDTDAAADNVLEAEISYDPRRTTLSSGMETIDGRVEVTISGKNPNVVGSYRARSEEWAVSLNPDVATHLAVNGGVGASELDLRAARLTRLEVNAGVGEVEVRLPASGAYSVDINGGVGALTLELPANVEARVHVDTGLGEVTVDRRFTKRGNEYVTAGYDSADGRVEIEIDGGVGSIEVK